MFDDYYKNKLLKKVNPELRFIERTNVSIANCRKIHIIGISGTAMGTCALMLRDAGFEVTGSDTSFWPPMGPLLKSKGIHIYEGWHENHIDDSVDVVIVGNACPPHHIEVISARKKNKPLMSMPEVMNTYFIGHDKESLVVAGTHGKTTTTGLLSHVLSFIGKDPTYLIGGLMQNSTTSSNNADLKEGTSHHVGRGPYAIFEGDEYDTSFFDARPKFLHYNPSYTIITSVELDHVDIYPDIETYTTAFEHIVTITKKGLVVANTPLINNLVKKTIHHASVVTYGSNNQSDIYPLLKRIDNRGQHFELFIKNNSFGEYSVPLYGEYNMLNAISVLGLLYQMNIDIRHSSIREALESFPGMKRRQEIIAEIKGITVIDDFAHHPTAVKETLKGIRTRFPKQRIIAVFEPRSNSSRRKVFEHTYPEALAQADIVGIKIPPYREEVDAGQDLLNPNILKKEIEQFGKSVYLSETAHDLAHALYPIIEQGDVVVIMSNGSFDGIHDMLLSLLMKK